MTARHELDLELPVLLPLHRRTCQWLVQLGESTLASVRVIDPLPYLQMQRVITSAAGFLTDSGGLQKEAFFHKVPCITLRNETEWIETVEAGWNQLGGADTGRIVAAVAVRSRSIAEPPALFGDGAAAESLASAISGYSGTS
jgi:UDP-GlcNAc3NAcA epimerase